MTERQTVGNSGVTCRNCGHVFDSPYCPMCGQAASTSRFTLADIFRIVLDAFDFQHGLLRLIRVMTLHPAAFIRDYLAGKRVRVFGPIRYLLLTAALLALAYGVLDLESMASVCNDDGVEQMVNYSASSWMSLLIILSIPFYAVCTRLLFRKWGFCFAEHIVLNMFIIAHVNLFATIFSVVFLWAPQTARDTTLLFTLLYPIVVYVSMCERHRLLSAFKGLIVALTGFITFQLLVLGLIILDTQILNGALGLAVF